MTDGILDVLVLILVLGVVLGACFGFVLPVVDNAVMNFDDSLSDKSATFMVEDKNAEEYTGDMNIIECMLTLCVQDSKVPAPKQMDVVRKTGEYELSSYATLGGEVIPKAPVYKTEASVVFDGMFRNNLQLYCISVDRALASIYADDAEAYNDINTLYRIEYMFNVATTNDFTKLEYDDKFRPHDCEKDDVIVFPVSGGKLDSQDCVEGSNQYNHEYFERYILKKVG